MDDDPIREPETLLQKIKKIFKKNKKLPIEFEYIYTDDVNCAWRKFGLTAEEASERIMKFSKVLTPNEMRELIERRTRNGR